MANKKVSVGKLSAEIGKVLKEYETDIVSRTNAIVDGVADYAVRELRDTSPGRKRRGSYATGWTRTKPSPGSRGVGIASITVYNRTKPQLAHLLENGTAERTQRKTGRRTGKMVGDHHIAAVEDKTETELLKRLEALGNG